MWETKTKRKLITERERREEEEEEINDSSRRLRWLVAGAVLFVMIR